MVKSGIRLKTDLKIVIIFIFKRVFEFPNG